MSVSAVYAGHSDAVRPTAAIWGDCPIRQIQIGNVGGFGFHDDFLNIETMVTTEVHQGYYAFLDGNTATILPVLGLGGGLALFGSTDNEECGFSRSGTLLNAPFMISDTLATSRKLWFECRVKRSVITDAKGGFFVGMADEAACANEFMTDAGGVGEAADALIGFHSDETDDSLGSHVHAIYQASSQTQVKHVDTVATMVADTYMKLGFVYDPDASASKQIKWYVDGVEDGTGVTATQIATATFPDAEPLTPIIQMKNAHADDFTVTIPWWRVYQLR